jgi:hypothetical protein
MVRYTQHQLAHVYVEQSPEITHGSIESGNFYFQGPTLYSFRDSWPLATFVPGRANPRVILVNTEDSGHRGWNSDGKQRRLLDDALRGREDIQISVNRAQIIKYISDQRAHGSAAAWTSLGVSQVAAEIEKLKDKAERYAKPLVNAWDVIRPDGHAFAEGSDDEREARCRSISDARIFEIIELFGPGTADTPAHDIEALRQIIREGYAKFNDPKRVAARAKSARNSCVRKTMDAIDRFLEDAYGWERGRRVSKINPEMDAIVAEAVKLKPDLILPKLAKVSEKMLEFEIERVHQALHPLAPDVKAAQNQRRYEIITSDEWRASRKGNLARDWGKVAPPTMVRRVGDVVETSRGAEVPFKDAVRLYQLAAKIKERGVEFVPDTINEGRIRCGVFQLTKITKDGDCVVGCHYLMFDEMERLAIKEVPRLVKPRYPLPVPIAA